MEQHNLVGAKQPKMAKLRYVQSKNSLTWVALLEEILRICSNNKLRQVTAPSETSTHIKTETPFIKTHR